MRAVRTAPEEGWLQRLFSTFPSGSPGIGLLLLRVGTAIVLMSHGVACLAQRGLATWGTWAVGAMTGLAGALLLIGLMTPLAGAVAALGGAATALSWLPSPAPSAFDPGFAGVLPVVAAVAITLLGPGAISVDAALFGRREITIPRSRDGSAED